MITDVVDGKRPTPFAPVTFNITCQSEADLIGLYFVAAHVYILEAIEGSHADPIDYHHVLDVIKGRGIEYGAAFELMSNKLAALSTERRSE